MSAEKKVKKSKTTNHKKKTNNKTEIQDLFKLGTIKKFTLKKFISEKLLKLHHAEV